MSAVWRRMDAQVAILRTCKLVNGTDAMVYGALMRGGITPPGGKAPLLLRREVPVSTIHPTDGQLKSVYALADAFLTD